MGRTVQTMQLINAQLVILGSTVQACRSACLLTVIKDIIVRVAQWLLPPVPLASTEPLSWENNKLIVLTVMLASSVEITHSQLCLEPVLLGFTVPLRLKFKSQ